MTSQDFLFFSLAIGFLILVGAMTYASYRLAEALQSLKALIDSVEDTANDINLIKNKIKIGALTTFIKLLEAFIKKRR